MNMCAVFSKGRFARFRPHVLIWYCYIDDVIVFWTGTEPELLEFMGIMEVNHFNLKFTMHHDVQSIPFLDFRIFKHSDGSIGTTFYQKSTGAWLGAGL